MRIGFLFHEDVSNVVYRLLGPANAAQHLGHEVKLVRPDRDHRLDLSSLLRCDVVHLYRSGGPGVMDAVERLHEHGVAVTWDNDDDIRLRPEGTEIAELWPPELAQADFDLQIEMIRRADVVTTPSGDLAALYRTISPMSVVEVENYLLPEQYSGVSLPHQGLVIGWVAGIEHLADSRNLQMSETLTEVLQQHPEVHVTSIGVDLDIDSPRYRHVAGVPFADLKDHIRQFDLAIAPLSDIPTSYARSNVKVKEYAAAGVPWLASRRGPYSNLGPDQGGMLVGDEDWGRALSVLIEADDLRATLRQRARAWARTQTVQRHADEWGQVFEQAVANAERDRGEPGLATRRSAGAGA